MEKKYLSIQEYADICGVSYHAIYKRLNKNLLPFVEVVNGHKMLKVEVLENETLTPNLNELKKENLTPRNFSEPNLTKENEEEIYRINKRNEDIIDELRAQLKDKDEQIKKQNEHILELSMKLTDLIENNQKLLLHSQLLLGDTKEQVYEEEYEQGARAQEVAEEIPIEKPKRKSIFRRMFNL